MNTSEIRNWVEENHLVDQTFKSFWVSMNNYIEEELDEFQELFGEYKKERVQPSFHHYAVKTFAAENDDDRREHIEVFLTVEYSGRAIGYYKTLFDFDGEAFDDFLVWDWEEWVVYQKIEALKEIKKALNSKKAEEIKANDLSALIDEMIEQNIKQLRK